MPTTVTMTAALTGYLRAYTLPDPAAVTLYPATNEISLQPGVLAHNDPVAVLTVLLLWTRGLTTVTAHWARVREGDAEYVHVSISGRLASGVRMHVYKSFPYPPVREWVLLGSAGETVSLDELAWLVRELHTVSATH